MKILVAVDMEGVSGVVHWDQVSPDHAEYGRFRRLMTAEVNAAVRGAFDAGADEVVVTDGHAYGRNLLIEELDPRARLHSGSPAPLSMVQGADGDVSAAMFVGYHARAGASNAILDHTVSSSKVMNVWLNDRLVGETGINAAVCGHFGVPVIMISGDQTVSAEATELLGQLETAVVKQASGRMAAECLPPERAQQAIYDAALRAVRRLLEGSAPKPFHLAAPITLRIQMANSTLADSAALLLGARPLGDRQLEFVVDDVLAAYRAMRTAIAVG